MNTMKKLLVNGEGVNIYFNADTSRTDILVWLHRKLVETQIHCDTDIDVPNVFNLNEPMSCSVFDYSSVISKNSNNFLIKGDEDYKEVEIVNVNFEL